MIFTVEDHKNYCILPVVGAGMLCTSLLCVFYNTSPCGFFIRITERVLMNTVHTESLDNEFTDEGREQ